MITEIKNYIEQLVEKNDLSLDESYQLMNAIMEGEVNNSHLAAILIALKSKGETPEEVAGFAKAMRDKSVKINCEDGKAIDVCGTGGDYSESFNVSTAAAFTVAGAGVKVAKHGNRSISSKSGSADVLSELGININLTQEQSETALNKIGIAFLFAPAYHPAMKYAAPVRKELGIKTVFNILGPLTNPAGVKRQLVGAFNRKAARTMAQAAKYLDYDKAVFLCNNNKYDEVFLEDTTDIYEYAKPETISSYAVSNKTFGYQAIPTAHIKGSSPDVNAKILMDLFTKKLKDGIFYTTTANAALGLYSAGYSEKLEECKLAAEESILSGAALKKLNQLIDYSKSC